MTFSLSGIDRVSRVRSGYGSGNQVKAFPYPGAIGLAGLGQVTARVTGLRLFPYAGAIGLAGLG
jgi:hypothetical protein